MSRPRQFDWGKARRMRARGMTYTAIAAELGVTAMAVSRVCDKRRYNQMAEFNARYQRSGTCIDCGKKRSFNATNAKNGIDKGRCMECAAVAASTSVRDDALKCVTCKEWKWDTAFPWDRRMAGRRGRHRQCTACNTEAMRKWRQENPEQYAATQARNNERKRQRRREAKAA